ncbi:MAG: hypothetical protein MUO35_08325, partial [Anaerolineales bacterium]|nr:hypothetical protein [Anaerolineales bacterium]
MKIAILGAAGMRMPLLYTALAARQERLDLRRLTLMDDDERRLHVVAGLSQARSAPVQGGFDLQLTTRLEEALDGSDYVITTFRVGGMESRVIDERVPLAHGLLGQETTGAGGFAMAMRTLPVLLGVLNPMRSLCPQAWLVNFANPSGLLAEAIHRVGRWPRAVGICDGPATMHRLAASLLDVDASEVYLDYFGLNHLGWARRVLHRGEDYLPTFLAMIRAAGGFPGLPFDPEFLTSLGMIPNEYLYYYYQARQAVDNIVHRGQTRGEFLLALNQACMADLEHLHRAERPEAMAGRYETYLEQRSQTYMLGETGTGHELSNAQVGDGGGYAGVALDLIETLHRGPPRVMILNLPNQGAVAGMDVDDVVEIPALVGKHFVHPLAVGDIPAECLGLMQRVKAYERLTIEAAVEGSLSKALEALTLHPLVGDLEKARAILSEFRTQQAAYFPPLR